MSAPLEVVSWRLLSLLLLGFSSCGFSNSTAEDEGDPPTVGFEFVETGTDEQTGMALIPIVLSHPATTEVSVSYMLLNAGTATPNVDFEIATGTLIFPVGATRREVPVTIKDDGIEGEAAESFDIALGQPKGAELDQDHAIHSVRISDHILPRVTVGPAATMSSEGAPSTLVIQLNKPAEPGSFVVVGVDGGTPFPTNGDDLTLVNNSMITIPTGAMMVAVAIGEKDDQLDEEDNETAVFTLRSASTNLVLGLVRNVNHNITDNDDPPIVRFSMGAQNVPENAVLGGTVATVQLAQPSGRTVKVDYTRDGADTADAGDATVVGSTGTFTFNPGQTSKTIIITVNNDGVDEDDETVVINLINLVNAQAGPAPVLTHTVTINDNDTAAVSFQSSSATVDENSNGGINVTVRLSTQSAKTVMVPFTLNGGMTTATDGQDFSIQTSSPLTFDPGQTTATIAIDVPDNQPSSEPDEFVVIDLGTPTAGGATLGSPARFSLRIQE